MAESLAVMTVLWELDTTDVIVLSQHRPGGYDNGEFNKTCVQIPQQPPLGDHIQAYLRGKYVQNNPDLPLYDAANRSLDKTIDHLGRDTINRRAKEITYLQGLAEYNCQSHAVFPCSETGVPQFEQAKESCFVQDAGCGHACVEQVMHAFRTKRNAQKG